MKTNFPRKVVATAAGLMALTAVSARGATNSATDPGGGGVTLTASGAVTVTSTTLQLVKQVWNGTGTSCLASQPADATCSASATAITVPAGTSLQFLIYVKNNTDLALSDVRFQDTLDISGTGFTYTAASIKRTANDATAPLDTDTAATIHTAASIAQTDAVGAPDDYAMQTGANLTVGAVFGFANQVLNVPAHKAFGIVFSVIKK